MRSIALSAVNYEPVTNTDLVFIGVNIYPGSGKVGLKLIALSVYFNRITIYPAALAHNINRGHQGP